MPRRIQKRYWNKMIKSFCYAKLRKLILCCTFSDIDMSGTKKLKLNFYLAQNKGFETLLILVQWYYYKYCYTTGFQRIYICSCLIIYPSATQTRVLESHYTVHRVLIRVTWSKAVPRNYIVFQYSVLCYIILPLIVMHIHTRPVYKT